MKGFATVTAEIFPMSKNRLLEWLLKITEFPGWIYLRFI